MLEVFTNDTQEQALLQWQKSDNFEKSSETFWFLGELERVPTKLLVTLSASEGLIAPLPEPEPSTYKHQEHYLCFYHDFDNEDNDNDNKF